MSVSRTQPKIYTVRIFHEEIATFELSWVNPKVYVLSRVIGRVHVNTLSYQQDYKQLVAQSQLLCTLR